MNTNNKKKNNKSQSSNKFLIKKRLIKTRTHRKQTSKTNCSDEVSIAKESRTLIPDGVYEVQLVDIFKRPFMNTKKIYGKCIIISGPYMGEHISIVFQTHETYGPRSKLHKVFSHFLGRKLRKGERINERRMLNSVFKIRTRTVAKDEDGDLYPDFQRYSVVDKVLELLVRDKESHSR